MKTAKLLLYSVLIGSLIFTSCKKDEEEKIDESQVLTEYLESANSPLGKDYVNSDMPAIIGAAEVKTLNETNQVYIMDIRSAADFATGHIANAHNVAFADILTHIKNVNLDSYTKVAIVCYTGQTASYAASILRLMGYGKVYSMKWGMSSWNVAFNRWSSNLSNTYASQFTSTATDKGAAGSLPTLSTGKTTGQEILEARAATIISEGFDPAKITNATVFGSLSNYYIVNYWPAAQYAAPGHIPGAMQYTPKESIKLSADLKTLPTNKTIVVYCYTGQTSAHLTAYLRLLGYDAKSLLFGTNGMIYDNMVATGGMSVFKDTEIMGYDYVTGK
ncbi:MAG: rhodanese-like domain-containing protein [Bacteroidales bacterium]|jgi:rhodanese-related sulfurtransferase|nr:rhodanese-like domain-containing protein [Bacteroidales bacterium]